MERELVICVITRVTRTLAWVRGQGSPFGGIP